MYEESSMPDMRKALFEQFAAIVDGYVHHLQDFSKQTNASFNFHGGGDPDSYAEERKLLSLLIVPTVSTLQCISAIAASANQEHWNIIVMKLHDALNEVFIEMNDPLKNEVDDFLKEALKISRGPEDESN